MSVLSGVLDTLAATVPRKTLYPVIAGPPMGAIHDRFTALEVAVAMRAVGAGSAGTRLIARTSTRLSPGSVMLATVRVGSRVTLYW